jgi:hypothetical protein
MRQADAAVAAAIAVLGRGGAPAAAGVAAESAAADAEEEVLDGMDSSSRGNGEVEVDEFGRTVVLMRHREHKEGTARRKGLVAAQLEQLERLRAGMVGLLNLGSCLQCRNSKPKTLNPITRLLVGSWMQCRNSVSLPDRELLTSDCGRPRFCGQALRFYSLEPSMKRNQWQQTRNILQRGSAGGHKTTWSDSRL